MKTVDLTLNPFTFFNDTWGLISAGKKDHFNEMTISWGSMGILWNKNIMNVYVRTSRYTYGFLNDNDHFSVCFFPEEYKKDLLYLGTVSGRDEDKLSKTSLTPYEVDGVISYDQAEYTFVLKKIYTTEMLKKDLPEDVQASMYDNEEDHFIFTGEIEAVYQNKVRIY